MQMILCCGEALMDMIPAKMQNGQVGYVPCTGGALFNTAIALGRLGAPVGLLSGVSHDTFGQQLADALRENHVNTDLLVRSDLLTTLAVVHLRDGSATYSFYDDNSAGRMLTLQDMPALPSEVSALFFGGISLVSAPAADAYADFLIREHKGRVVMMDPNIRQAFITDEGMYRARLDAMMGHCDIVKVSDDDLDWLVGGGAALEDQARALIAKGPRFVVVTLGAKGAMAVSAAGVVHQPAIAAQVADTVGAGDTFNAGFLAALEAAGLLTVEGVSTMDIADLGPALAHGAKVAAVTVSRVGANPPWAAELG